MKYINKVLTACILFAVAAPSFSQSINDMASARALARSYGYSDDEINSVLNGASPETVVVPTAPQQTVIPNQALPGGIDENGIEQPIEVAPVEESAPKSDIFGHDFFISKGLSLIPSITAPVPESYILGPGDEMTVSIWGAANATFNVKVGSDGSVMIPRVGPVYVSGTKLSAAEKMIKSRLSGYYSGLDDGSSSMHVAIGKIRGISVYVLGQVLVPGVYTLPSLCNIATAIFMAGGINSNGSVRNIMLYRDGKKVAEFDLYAFIFSGKFNTGFKLQDGDIIAIPQYTKLVRLEGEVHRAKRFEMLDGESVEDLLKYAGGFNASARRDIIHVDRVASEGGTTFDVPSELFSSFGFCDEDVVYVSKDDDSFTNRVNISGNVVHAGPYSISDGMHTVSQLIAIAGGLKEGTSMERAYIRRLDKDKLPVQVSFSLADVVAGRSDIELVRDDEIRIFSSAEVSDNTRKVIINGEVNSPGDFDFRQGMTLGDLLLLAGGAKDGADLSRVEIAVRGRETKGTVVACDLTNPEAFSIPLNPYDKVFVRSYEHYRGLKSIQITGEVKYPGYYAVEKNTVRLSDIVSRASGFTDDAYIRGTKLKRRTLEGEVETAEFIQRIAEENKYKRDTVSIDSLKNTLKVGDYYSISVNMEEVLKHPDTDVDIILRDGDIISVPQMNNTVKISGGVYLPNVVAYNPKYSWRDYVNLAGGFVKGVRKSHIYAVYQDGSSAVRGSSGFRMEPGMELVIPQIDKGERQKMSAGEIAALASVATSITSIIVLVVNSLSRR